MGILVQKLNKRIRCEVFPCKEPAEFSIGRVGHKQLNFNVCREDAKQIMEDLIELFSDSEELELVGVEESMTVETISEETFELDTTPTTDENAEGEEVIEEAEKIEEQKQEEPVSKEIVAPEPVKEEIEPETYSCKYCGATFPKTPEGRTALMTHSKACAKLAKTTTTPKE